MSKKKNKSAGLPDKPSKLIRLAVKDLKKVENSKKYKVYMPVWHQPPWDEEMVCNVCFAGAVMAKSLHVKRYKEAQPQYFDSVVESKLRFLDGVRTGSSYLMQKFLSGYWFELGRKPLPWRIPLDGRLDFDDWDVVAYDSDPDLFKEQMLSIARGFERVGL